MLVQPALSLRQNKMETR